MKKIASFTIDHIKLQPGIYVSRKDYLGDQVITTFDIRMTSPNEEPVMNTAELHAMEHLAATFLRNHAEFGPKVIYWGPMGCQTGFYVSLLNEPEYQTALDLIENTLKDVLAATEVPACNEVQCGWAASHSLEGAKALARQLLDKRSEWEEVFA